jgi:hypothetical protein
MELLHIDYGSDVPAAYAGWDRDRADLAAAHPDHGCSRCGLPVCDHEWIAYTVRGAVDCSEASR